MNFGVFAFQAVPDSPSPQGTGQTAAPTPDAAPAAPPGGIATFLPFLILIPFMLILFFQNRSQQKKQEANIAALKKGDRVVTQSGLIGRLVSVEGRYAELELLPSRTKVMILRSGLLGRDAESEAPSAEAAADKSKSSSS